MSHICDTDYLGLETLRLFRPLLKPPVLNPHANLIGLFMNAFHEVFTDADDGNEEIAEAEANRTITLLEFPPGDIDYGEEYGCSAESHRVLRARAMVRDHDVYWKRYVEQKALNEVSANAGLEVKEENTLMAQSLGLRKGATQEEAELLLASYYDGCERYVEWRVKQEEAGSDTPEGECYETEG